MLAIVGAGGVLGALAAPAIDELQRRVQASSTTIAMSLGWLGPLAVGAIFAHSGAIATVSVVAGWTLLLALAATVAPPLRSATIATERPAG